MAMVVGLRPCGFGVRDDRSVASVPDGQRRRPSRAPNSKIPPRRRPMAREPSRTDRGISHPQDRRATGGSQSLLVTGDPVAVEEVSQMVTTELGILAALTPYMGY